MIKRELIHLIRHVVIKLRLNILAQVSEVEGVWIDIGAIEANALAEIRGFNFLRRVLNFIRRSIWSPAAAASWTWSTVHTMKSRGIGIFSAISFG